MNDSHKFGCLTWLVEVESWREKKWKIQIWSLLSWLKIQKISSSRLVKPKLEPNNKSIQTFPIFSLIVVLFDIFPPVSKPNSEQNFTFLIKYSSTQLKLSELFPISTFLYIFYFTTFIIHDRHVWVTYTGTSWSEAGDNMNSELLLLRNVIFFIFLCFSHHTIAMKMKIFFSDFRSSQCRKNNSWYETEKLIKSKYLLTIRNKKNNFHHRSHQRSQFINDLLTVGV